VACWLALATGGFAETPLDGPSWPDTDGWDDVRRVATFSVLDVDGDGMADVCGRGEDGYACHLSLGTSFGEALVVAELSDGAGWTDPARYLGLRLGDVDGDGDRDLCGPDADGWRCWPWDGGGFGAAGPAVALGLDVDGVASLRMGDVTGDGRADVCGGDEGGVRCWASDGAGFGAAFDGPAWAGFEPIRLGGWWAPAASTQTGTGTTSPSTTSTGATGEGSGDPDLPGSGSEDEAGAGLDRRPLGEPGCGCASGPRGGTLAWSVLLGWLGLGCALTGRAARTR
jgi:hypothetical protein